MDEVKLYFLSCSFPTVFFSAVIPKIPNQNFLSSICLVGSFPGMTLLIFMSHVSSLSAVAHCLEIWRSEWERQKRGEVSG